MTKPASRFTAAPLRCRRRAPSHHPSCIGVPRANISKHLAILVSFGLLQRTYGNLCSIPACYLVPSQRALDFGAVLLRLDRLDAK